MSATLAVRTLAEQICEQSVPHTMLLAKDERTLRVHHKRAGGFVFNTDVSYDDGRDLYDVVVYKLDMRMSVAGAWNPHYAEVVGEARYAGAYWDQLPDLIGKL